MSGGGTPIPFPDGLRESPSLKMHGTDLAAGRVMDELRQDVRGSLRLLLRSPAFAAVVVLNWDRLDDTLGCLESLAETDWPTMITIVVDNGSDQQIEASITARF